VGTDARQNKHEKNLRFREHHVEYNHESPSQLVGGDHNGPAQRMTEPGDANHHQQGCVQGVVDLFGVIGGVHGNEESHGNNSQEPPSEGYTKPVGLGGL